MLGNILIELKKITKRQLDKALEIQYIKKTNMRIGEILIELGYVSPKDVVLALSKQLDIPYVELGEDFRLTPDKIALIPESVAREFCLIPYKRTDEAITVVMADPVDIEAVDMVRILTGLEVHKAISTEGKIKNVIDKFYKEEAHIEKNIQDIVDLETAERTIPEKRVDSDQLKVLAEDAPVVKFVNLLLLQSVRDRASDIHFEPGEKEVRVRLRIDGVLREIIPPPKRLYEAVVTRIKILADMDVAERRLPQDGRFKFKVRDRMIDVRVSSLPETNGEKLVLRILDRESVVKDISGIMNDTDMLARFKKILKQPNGIILLTGPTGSGKTTTLYSALNFLKVPTKNVQTVEDPVEYQIEGINQMQVKSPIGLTFASALRSILRQDPDIIMVGEIRDLDTAKIAMRASLTGHLVLSTLHTNDTTSAFNRLKDIGVNAYLIADTIRLVISQRLVRTLCESCKKKAKPSESDLKLIKSIYPDADKWKYYEGKGCKNCFKTGYRGRTGIFEFLEVDDVMKGMILNNVGENILRKKAIESGMDTLFMDGLKRVKEGVTTIDKVLAVCPEEKIENK